MIDLLRTRRSIRKYTSAPIAEEHVVLLKEAVLRCPSSRGINPWSFVFVDDHQLLTELARAKPHGSSFLKHATLAIVVCGDETRSDMWIEDCSIAATVAHVAAHSLELGSCWVQIRSREHGPGVTAEAFVQELLAIPAQQRVEAIIGVGHLLESKPGHDASTLDHSKIRCNRWLG